MEVSSCDCPDVLPSRPRRRRNAPPWRLPQHGARRPLRRVRPCPPDDAQASSGLGKRIKKLSHMKM